MATNSRLTCLAFAVCCAAVAAAFAPSSRADGVIRCRSGRLVNVGMTSAEVIGRCGEPKNRVVEDVPVRAQGARGAATVIVGTTRHERWTIERGQGQFDAVLYFEGDKFVNIELLTTR